MAPGVVADKQGVTWLHIGTTGAWRSSDAQAWSQFHCMNQPLGTVPGSSRSARVPRTGKRCSHGHLSFPGVPSCQSHPALTDSIGAETSKIAGHWRKRNRSVLNGQPRDLGAGDGGRLAGPGGSWSPNSHLGVVSLHMHCNSRLNSEVRAAFIMCSEGLQAPHSLSPPLKARGACGRFEPGRLSLPSTDSWGCDSLPASSRQCAVPLRKSGYRACGDVANQSRRVPGRLQRRRLWKGVGSGSRSSTGSQRWGACLHAPTLPLNKCDYAFAVWLKSG